MQSQQSTRLHPASPHTNCSGRHPQLMPQERAAHQASSPSWEDLTFPWIQKLDSHLFCPHHADWLALEEMVNELGDEGATGKEQNNQYSTLSTKKAQVEPNVQSYARESQATSPQSLGPPTWTGSSSLMQNMQYFPCFAQHILLLLVKTKE